ncbi:MULTISPECIES: hypothetical protein, partial [unclassified Vibrio]|uniref:hypothetical protein n=1 Tax=unclassified Vibrio TaxID=2614977 RepID=UPI0020A3E999
HSPTTDTNTPPKILDRWVGHTRLTLVNPINPCNPDTLLNYAEEYYHDCAGVPVSIRSLSWNLGLIG